MIGSKNVFIALCNNDELFPNFVSYPCGTHLQVLCAEVLPFKRVLCTVTKILKLHQSSATATQAFQTTFGRRPTRVLPCNIMHRSKVAQ